MELNVFLNSQQAKEMASNDFLKQMQESVKPSDEDKFNNLVHMYLSFCCQLGGTRISEKLDENYHKFMPDMAIMRPTFQNVNQKDKRQNDEAMRASDEEEVIDPA